MGQWKNFDELEENLCLAELEMILDAHRKAQYNQNKFLAALKGINLEEGAAPEESPVERAKRRLAAAEAGMTDEEYDLTQAGFGIETDEEE